MIYLCKLNKKASFYAVVLQPSIGSFPMAVCRCLLSTDFFLRWGAPLGLQIFFSLKKKKR